MKKFIKGDASKLSAANVAGAVPDMGMKPKKRKPKVPGSSLLKGFSLFGKK